MKICGIIAEYNPFHNGHEYHISEARRITGCDFVVVCMSGDYVQRGLPAITDKYSRTKAALEGGADMVVELPVICSVASAELFAYGAVSILDSIGCDYLCFGSETEDVTKLKKIAELYDTIEEDHLDELKLMQKSGLSYAKALDVLSEKIIVDKGYLINPKSNDRLGIAYIRAMNKIQSHMNIAAVKRKGGDYLDESMAAGSAMAIRKSLESLEDLAYVKEFMPKYSFDCLFDDGKRSETDLVFLNDFSDLLYMKLVSIIQSSDNDEDARRKFTEYVDVSYNIAGKIVNNINKYSSLSDFAEKIHTSEYTKSRIYRALIHIVLDIKEIDILEFEKENSGYARLLGFRKKSGELLSFIKKNSPIKLISKTADAEMILSDAEYKMFKHDVDSAELYDYVQASKGKRSRISEFERQIIICI